MNDFDRFRLRFGPYRMPRCRVGRWLQCAIHGEVKVVGISDAPMQWPQSRVGRGSVRSIVVCGDLIEAIRQESNQAIAHWWGVSCSAVSLWRKALAAPRATPGTSQVYSESLLEILDAGAREKLLASLKSPERGAKISAAQRGRKRSPETIEKMRRARKGWKPTEETRARMRESHRLRLERDPAWAPEQEALLGTMPDQAVADELCRSVCNIWRRRRKLGIPRFVKDRSGVGIP
jgi:hypothetical protein